MLTANSYYASGQSVSENIEVVDDRPYIEALQRWEYEPLTPGMLARQFLEFCDVLEGQLWLFASANNEQWACSLCVGGALIAFLKGTDSLQNRTARFPSKLETRDVVQACFGESYHADTITHINDDISPKSAIITAVGILTLAEG